MSRIAIKIGPRDHGRRMSLADFDRADVEEGYLYELGRGVITVADVPNEPHPAIIDAIRLQFYAYRLAHPRRIHRIAAGSECKLLVPEWESERHPDLAIYLKARPRGRTNWPAWIPEIAIEVVSADSAQRDYHEKPDEYLSLGVSDYWIVDGNRQQILVLLRRGKRWVRQELGPTDEYRTRLLPGFVFDCGPVFEAAS